MPTLARIYFQVFQDAVADLPVVLLHGAGGSHLSWPIPVRRLAGAQVYALDLPGHGHSPDGGERTISAYAARVQSWMTAAGLSKVALAGHSMGSAIALTLALERPEQVLALALLGSAARLRVNPALLEAAASPATYLGAVEKVVQWSFSRGAPENLRRLVGRRLAEAGASVLHGDFVACDAFDASDWLGRIGCPTLVLCGAEDRMTPLHVSQALAEAIPGAFLQVIAGAGHMVMLEKPQEVADALGKFMRSLA